MKNLINTFLQIIYREIAIYFKIIYSKLIDISIMTATNVVIFTYLMPYVGVKSSYGPIIVVGLIAIVSLFEVVQRTTNFISDLSNNKKISYFLTLPLPTNLILTAIPIGWAACSALYTIFVLPIAKLLIYHRFNLDHFSFFKFIIGFFTVEIMCGFFAFFLASLIKDMKYISLVWSRVVNPLLMLGGYFYTWASVNSISHIVGILNLINPVMLSCECLRAAILGQEGFLDFWLTVLGLWLFTLFFAFFGITGLKKRLDCV